MKYLVILLFFTIAIPAAEQYIIITATKYQNVSFCSVPVLLDTDKYKDEILKEYLLKTVTDIYPSSSVKVFKSNSASEVKKLSKFSSMKYKMNISKSKFKRFARSRGIK